MIGEELDFFVGRSQDFEHRLKENSVAALFPVGNNALEWSLLYNARIAG